MIARFVVERQDADNGPEDLFLGDLHLAARYHRRSTTHPPPVPPGVPPPSAMRAPSRRPCRPSRHANGARRSRPGPSSWRSIGSPSRMLRAFRPSPDELCVDRPLDQHPRACRADFTRFTMTPEHGAFDGCFPRRIGEEDVRRLPPSPSVTFEIRIGGSAQDRAPGRRRTGERHLSTSGLAASAAPATGPSPVTILTTPFGSSMPSRMPARARSSAWLPQASRRAQAGAKRRSDLPRRHQQRIVPGTIYADADRPLERQRQSVVRHRVTSPVIRSRARRSFETRR